MTNGVGRRLRMVGLGLMALALTGVVNLLWTGWADAQTQPVSTDPALIAQGEQLYGNDCIMCHGAGGRGLETNQAAGGPPLLGVGPASVDLMLRTGRMPAISQFESLERRPPRYSDTQREALVAYITSLAPGEGPQIPAVGGWEDADLALGLEVFTSNCAACHGPTAAGVAVGQDDVSSDLSVSSPIVIAEAVRTGPGVMPVFGDDVLDHEELLATVAWVRDLSERESPGGISIGRSGPVSEGFIAWVVGMGLLGVVIYLLGERTGTVELLELPREANPQDPTDHSRANIISDVGPDPDSRDPDTPSSGSDQDG